MLEFVKTAVTGIEVLVEPISADAPVSAPNLITQSRLETWQACKRKHKHRYVDGYAAATEKQALSFGKAWHSFMEYWWMGRRDPAEIEERCLLPYKDFLDGLAYLQLEELVKGYSIAHPDSDEFDVAFVEKEFRATLFDPSINNKDRQEISGAFVIGGKIDGGITWRRDGVFGVLEHKTTTQSIESDADPYWDKLVGDHQLSIYMVGCDSMGLDAQRALYDVVRKPSIRPTKKETLEDYRARLAGEIAANPKSYFRWREVPRPTQEVFFALRDVWDAARLMEIEDQGSLSPRNPEACFKYGTSHRCIYYDTCFNGIKLEENAALIKSAPFQELEVGGEA